MRIVARWFAISGDGGWRHQGFADVQCAVHTEVSGVAWRGCLVLFVRGDEGSGIPQGRAEAEGWDHG